MTAEPFRHRPGANAVDEAAEWLEAHPALADAVDELLTAEDVEARARAEWQHVAAIAGRARHAALEAAIPVGLNNAEPGRRMPDAKAARRRARDRATPTR